MFPVKKNIAFITVCFLLIFTTVYVNAENTEADSYSVKVTPGDRWTIVSHITKAPEAFGDVLMQYKYRQKMAAKNVAAVNQALEGHFGTAITLKANPDCKSLALSEPAYNIHLPSLGVEQPVVGEVQANVITLCRDSLSAAGLNIYSVPYMQIPLLKLLEQRNYSTMGRILSWEAYSASLLNGQSIPALSGDCVAALFAPAIDGYPIIPTMYGAHTEDDVPMYAVVIVDEEKPVHMEIGFDYEIEKSKQIDGKPLSWETALDAAVYNTYHMWESAWAGMALETAGGFDYPGFFKKYDPRFVFQIESVQACYYASDGMLNPGWQVNLLIKVNLSNDKDLSLQDRHSYVPECLYVTHLIDAMTGENVG